MQDDFRQKLKEACTDYDEEHGYYPDPALAGWAVYSNWVRENVSEEEADKESREHVSLIKYIEIQAALKWFDEKSEEERMAFVKERRVTERFVRDYNKARGRKYVYGKLGEIND